MLGMTGSRASKSHSGFLPQKERWFWCLHKGGRGGVSTKMCSLSKNGNFVQTQSQTDVCDFQKKHLEINGPEFPEGCWSTALQLHLSSSFFLPSRNSDDLLKAQKLERRMQTTPCLACTTPKKGKKKIELLFFILRRALNSCGLRRLLDDAECCHPSGQRRVQTERCSLAMAGSVGSRRDRPQVFPREVILLSAKTAGEKQHLDLQASRSGWSGEVHQTNLGQKQIEASACRRAGGQDEYTRNSELIRKQEDHMVLTGQK